MCSSYFCMCSWLNADEMKYTAYCSNIKDWLECCQLVACSLAAKNWLCARWCSPPHGKLLLSINDCWWQQWFESINFSILIQVYICRSYIWWFFFTRTVLPYKSAFWSCACSCACGNASFWENEITDRLGSDKKEQHYATRIWLSREELDWFHIIECSKIWHGRSSKQYFLAFAC